MIRKWLLTVAYDHAVIMTKFAMRSSELDGVIWQQGESDCHRGGL